MRHALRHPPCHRRTGFTLMEVLATMVLVGIVLPVAMTGVSLSLAAADDARRKVEAISLAENKLMELAVDSTTSMGALSGDFGLDWPSYHWQASTTTRDVDVTELQIRVGWTARGTERFVSLSTLLYAGATSTGTTTGTGTTATSGGGG